MRKGKADVGGSWDRELTVIKDLGLKKSLM